ncbi:MAG: MATE family efflux transporter [Deltaproteobacteria bacterium]|nr:MATE family efflux transporter [Deltaproteobacteria bacterium]
MPERHPWLNLWRLAWPLVVAMFLQFSVGLTDAWIAGRFGADVQGAVGFAGQVLFLFNVLGTAMGVGLVAVVSRAEGAGDAAAVDHVARQGLLFAVLLTVPLSVAGVLWRPTVGELAFLPVAVAERARALLPLYAASLAPQAVLNTAAAVFRARGRTSLVLVTWGAAAALNLWWVFALAFGWGGLPALGPRGIAAATAASSAAGAAIAAALVWRGFRVRRPPGALRPDAALARRLWSLSWPAGLLQVGWNLGSLALYAILGSLAHGAVAATAALTNGLRIEALLYLPAFALNMVTAVVVGQALGAGDPAAAERSGWRVAGAATAVLSSLALPGFLFSRELAGLLTPDPAVREATHFYLRFNMVSQPFMALSICLGGGLQGAGDTRGTMKIVLGCLWGLRIPLALTLARPWGMLGVWAAMVVSMVLQGVTMAARFRRGAWKVGGFGAVGDGGRA